jgi:hypothetical protein
MIAGGILVLCFVRLLQPVSEEGRFLSPEQPALHQ